MKAIKILIFIAITASIIAYPTRAAGRERGPRAQRLRGKLDAREQKEKPAAAARALDAAPNAVAMAQVVASVRQNGAQAVATFGSLIALMVDTSYPAEQRCQKMEVILKKNGTVINKKVGGQTLLHAAAGVGQAETCELLLKYGAKIEEADTEKATPLIKALFGACQKTIKTLLACRANPNAAFENGQKKLATPLSIAVSQESGEIVQELLNAKADPDGPHSMLAIMLGKNNIVEMLLCANADPSRALPDGSPPLHNAVTQKNPELVKLLLQYKACPRVIWPPYTPLGRATMMGDIESVEYLLAAGAEVIFDPKLAFPPLLAACYMGNHCLTEKFLLKAFEIYLKPSNSERDIFLNMSIFSALLHASVSGFCNYLTGSSPEKIGDYMHIVGRILVLYGLANVNLEEQIFGPMDEFGITVFDLACATQYGPLIARLRSASSDFSKSATVGEEKADLQQGLLDEHSEAKETEQEAEVAAIEIEIEDETAEVLATTIIEEEIGSEAAEPAPPAPAENPSVADGPQTHDTQFTFFNKQIRKQFERLPHRTQEFCLEKLDQIIREQAGKKGAKLLKGGSHEIVHVRIGQYRIDYHLIDTGAVEILAAYKRSNLDKALKEMGSRLRN